MQGVVSVAFVIFGALLAVIGLLQLVISRRMVSWGFAWPPTVTAARISGAESADPGRSNQRIQRTAEALRLPGAHGQPLMRTTFGRQEVA